MSNIRYTHRNGETKPPDVSGAFWAENPEGRQFAMFVNDSTGALANDEVVPPDQWACNYSWDEWDMRRDSFEGWKWWGPVATPWDIEP